MSEVKDLSDALNQLTVKATAKTNPRKSTEYEIEILKEKARWAELEELWKKTPRCVNLALAGKPQADTPWPESDLVNYCRWWFDQGVEFYGYYCKDDENDGREGYEGAFFMGDEVLAIGHGTHAAVTREIAARRALRRINRGFVIRHISSCRYPKLHVPACRISEFHSTENAKTTETKET